MDRWSQQISWQMLALQEQSCHNINLVSPTHVVPQILQALLIASRKGLSLPLVYNSGGYESLETLEFLDGIMDIYMPDMKYDNPETAYHLSGITNYPTINRRAVREMHRQVGDLIIDQAGIAQRGLIVRHLVLPGYQSDTKNIVDFLSREISANTYVNIMAQYRPEHKANEYSEINRRISRREYQEAIQAARAAGLNRLDGVID